MGILKLKYLTTSLFFIKVKLSCNKPILLKYDYSRFNERKFVEDFQKIHLTCLNCSFDAEINYNKFLEDVTILVEKHMPIEKIMKREKKLRTKPWIDGKIQKKMQIGDRIFRKIDHDLYKTKLCGQWVEEISSQLFSKLLFYE